MSDLFLTKECDPAQVLKDILRIGVTNQPCSTGTANVSLLHQPVRKNSDLVGSQEFSGATKIREENISQQEPEYQKQQQIRLLGNDVDNNYSISGENVEIVASKSSGSTQLTPTSVKVEISSVAKYDWEHRFYFGNLVAVHQSHVFIAYAVREKSSDIVQVFNCQSAERILLKEFSSSSITDISFARSSDVILGCINSRGDLQVFKILTSSNGNLTSELLLHLIQSDVDPSYSYHRLIWCPFLPDRKEEDDLEDVSIKTAETMLALSTNNIVRVINVEVMKMMCGREPVKFNQLTSGTCMIDCHLQHVTDMALVPDGSTLATASADGLVRCFELDVGDSFSLSPRCIFKWKPHNGRPVSSMFFLDDLKNPTPEMQFWKFAITGADENREWKVWSCETWTCLQTITFSPSTNVPLSFQVLPCIKAQMDASATYMVLSDIRRKVIYVLNLEKDFTKGLARVSSVSEFLVAQPCLNLAVQGIVIEKRKKSLETLQQSEATEPLSGPMLANVDCYQVDQQLSMYVIQTKALQHLKIHLKSDLSSKFTLMPAASSNAVQLKDPVCDHSNFSDSENVSQVFAKGKHPADVVKSLELSTSSEISSLTHVTSFDEDDQMTGTEHLPLHIHKPFLPSTISTSVSESIDASHLTVHTKSKELSNAMAHISSIQLPHQMPGGSESASLVGFSSEEPSSSGDINTEMFNRSLSLGARPLLGNESSEPAAFDTGSSKVSDKNRRHSLSKELTRTIVPFSNSSSLLCDPTSSCSSIHNHTYTLVSSRSLESEQSSSDWTKDALIVFADRGGMHELQSQLHEISVILLDQRKAIEAIRRSLHQEGDSNPAILISNLQTRVNDLKMSISSKMQDAANQLATQNGNTVQKVAKDFDEKEKERLHHQLTTLSKIINDCLESQLESSIRHEMTSSVLPGISHIVEPFADKLNAELAHKLTATDALLKEQVKQLVRSKAIMDVIGRVAANTLETVLHSTCRDHLLPSFNRGCQNVLSQVDDAFQRGTSLYMQQMQKQMEEKIRKQQPDSAYSPVIHQIQGLIDALTQAKESREPLCKELNKLIGAIQQCSVQLEQQKTEFASTVNKAIDSLPTLMLDSIRDTVRKEVSEAMKEHQVSVDEQILTTFQSRSATPAPTPTSAVQSQRTHLMLLVQRGQFNAAFQEALSMMDLGVLIYICEMVSPTELFRKSPCPLDQPVLLSLIQQLSADLRTKIQLKCRYLEDAMLNIDHKSSVIRDYLPVILEQLCKNVETIQTTEHDPSLKRSLKMLLLTAQSLHRSLPSQPKPSGLTV